MIAVSHEMSVYGARAGAVTVAELDRVMRAIAGESLEGGDPGAFRFLGWGDEQPLAPMTPLVPEMMLLLLPPDPGQGSCGIMVSREDGYPTEARPFEIWAHLDISGDRSNEIVLAELVCAIALAKL